MIPGLKFILSERTANILRVVVLLAGLALAGFLVRAVIELVH